MFPDGRSTIDRGLDLARQSGLNEPKRATATIMAALVASVMSEDLFRDVCMQPQSVSPADTARSRLPGQQKGFV